MTEHLRFDCLKCGKKLKAPKEFAGKSAKCTCGESVRVPNHESTATKPEPQPIPPMPVQQRSGGNVPTGGVGLVFAAIFLIGIVIDPGGFYSVMIGGILGFVGFVISIVGIVSGSGRIAGVIGIVAFLIAWALNTIVVGH